MCTATDRIMELCKEGIKYADTGWRWANPNSADEQICNALKCLFDIIQILADESSDNEVKEI